MRTPPTSYQRYQRQTILPGFGDAGQYKLLSARVLVIGAGGLGCPVLQYLAAAGVGTLGIADHDMVNLTNLHRQVLYGMDDIGKPKAVVAAEKLKALNPEIQYRVFNEAVDTSNIIHMMKEFDVVVDGTDNFATRYLINDACVLMDKPLVFGAISRFEGQVAVFNVPSGMGDIIHYRDLFPHPPKDGEVLNCAEAGVLGVLPGIIGTMMANEVIKLLTGMGNSLSGSMLTYNANSNETMKWQLSKNKESDALVPATVAELRGKDYAWECGGPEPGLEINAKEVEFLLNSGEKVVLIDVRETGEMPALTRWPHKQIPLTKLLTGEVPLDAGSIVFICQSGKRSLTAAKWAKENFTGRNVYSMKGGVLGLEG